MEARRRWERGGHERQVEMKGKACPLKHTRAFSIPTDPPRDLTPTSMNLRSGHERNLSLGLNQVKATPS